MDRPVGFLPLATSLLLPGSIVTEIADLWGVGRAGLGWQHGLTRIGCLVVSTSKGRVGTVTATVSATTSSSESVLTLLKGGATDSFIPADRGRLVAKSTCYCV
jgi:hypothetical protein